MLFLVQAQARLLKARHEKGRNRTRERALLTMELLVEALSGAAQAADGQWGWRGAQGWVPQQGCC